MKKEDFGGAICFITAIIVCCLILILFIIGSLSITTGFLGRNIYLIGILILGVVLYLYIKIGHKTK